MTFSPEIRRLLDAGKLSVPQVLVAVTEVLAEIERSALERFAAGAVGAGCDAARVDTEIEIQRERLRRLRPARLELARQALIASRPPPTAH